MLKRVTSVSFGRKKKGRTLKEGSTVRDKERDKRERSKSVENDTSKLRTHSKNNVNNITSSASVNGPIISNNINNIQQNNENEGVKAVVLWKYVPEQEDEIALQKNDIITVYEQDVSGWWTGETQEGTYGLFPGKFVKLLEDPKGLIKETISSSPSAPPVVQDTKIDDVETSEEGKENTKEHTEEKKLNKEETEEVKKEENSTSEEKEVEAPAPSTPAAENKPAKTPRLSQSKHSSTGSPSAAALVSAESAANSSSTSSSSSSSSIETVQKELEVEKTQRREWEAKYHELQRKYDELELNKELVEWKGVAAEGRGESEVEQKIQRLAKERQEFEEEKQRLQSEAQEKNEANASLRKEVEVLKEKLASSSSTCSSSSSSTSTNVDELKQLLESTTSKLQAEISQLKMQLSQESQTVSIRERELELEKKETERLGNLLKHTTSISTSTSSENGIVKRISSSSTLSSSFSTLPTASASPPASASSSSSSIARSSSQTALLGLKASFEEKAEKEKPQNQKKPGSPNGSTGTPPLKRNTSKGSTGLSVVSANPIPKGDKPIREVIEDVEQRFNTNPFLSGEGKKLKKTGIEHLN